MTSTSSSNRTPRPHSSPLNVPPVVTIFKPKPAPTATSLHSRLLPEECLEAIFEYLARDLSTLHSLLLVSRAFFRIALPFLYSSPFDLLESHLSCSSSLSISPQERTRRHATLLYLLMSCCSAHHPSTLSSPQVANNDNYPHLPIWDHIPPVDPQFQAKYQALKSPSVDYLSAYRHFFLCMNLSRTFRVLFPNIQEYVPPSHATQRSQIMSNTTITMFTHNEIERIFLLHRPHVVRTISLSTQRLETFWPVGLQLSNLYRFELYGIKWHFDLNPTVQFLEEHSNLFGTIREVKFAGPNDVRALQKPSLRGVIKAIKNPRVIDLSRYFEAVWELGEFEIQNKAGLKKLILNLEYSPRRPLTLDATTVSTTSMRPDQQPSYNLDLIQQCPNLSTLQTGVQSPTAFSWARDAFLHNPLSLQQLRVLHLSADRAETIKQVLEDCIFAFQHSLEDLKGIALKLSLVVQSNVPQASLSTFGWSWPLNRLSVLHLRGELAAWFDLESLKFCPKLTEIVFNLQPYSPPKDDHLEKLVLAQGLKVLTLIGRWVLSDKIMTKLGEGLPKLKQLTIDSCQVDTLTAMGLKRGLDRMNGLERLDIKLGPDMDATMRDYRRTRPELDIFMRSDDSSRC